MAELVLVLGAGGGFGGAIAAELARAGIPVRAFVRRAEQAAALADSPGVEIVEGDAQDRSRLAQCAEGVATIVHAINYPYPQWDPAMREVSAKIIATARDAGARLVFPGNVYGFSPEAGRALPEDAPQEPATRKGRLRAEIEFMIQRGTDDGRMAALIVRSGDFYGPTVRNGLVDRVFGRAAQGRAIQALGRLTMPHQWAYVPDVARLAVALLRVPQRLRPFEVVHVAGHVVMRQLDFLREVAAAAGRPNLPIRTMPWWLVRLGALIDPMARELLELAYLFDEAIILDDPNRRRLLPEFQPTPLATAIAVTLGSYRRPGGA
ncbi:MAG: SDR family NAD(P)-dependent oxidoreductase [Phreatobacter sp.]|nr:SDR family NAD(P)-dependent oxidoreductase [Phreatobacter sp.]